MNKFLSFFWLIIIVNVSFGQTVTGPNSPSTFADGGGGSSGNTWLNTGNASASDGSYATHVMAKNKTSTVLKIKGFNFAIPSTDVVTNIKVEIERFRSAGTGTLKDQLFQLLINGTATGSDKSSAANWATADPNTYVTYNGTVTAYWGIAAGLTGADVNNANFGIAIQVDETNVNAATAAIDHVRITVTHQSNVYYSLGGNWEDASSWSTVGFGGAAASTSPPAGAVVIIGDGKTITKTTSTALSIASLQIDATGVLDMGTQTGLTITTFSSTGTGGNGIIKLSTGAATATFPSVTTNNFCNSTDGTVEYYGATNYNLPGTPLTYPNLVISGSAGKKSCNDNITINGELTVSATFENVNKTIAISGDCNLLSGGTLQGTTNASAFNITGIFNFYEGGIITTNPTSAKSDINANGGLLVFDGGTNAEVGAVDFTVTGSSTINGTLYFAGFTTGKKIFKGAITLGSGGVWDNSIGEDPELNGDIVNNGSWIGCSAGSCDYKYGKQIAGTYSISGNPVLFSNLTIQNNTTIVNTGTVVIGTLMKGSTLATSVFTNSTNGKLYLSGTGTPVDLTKLSLNTATEPNYVYYDYAGAQNIVQPNSGGTSYSILYLSSSGVKTILTSPLVIDSLLTIEGSAQLTVSAAQTLSGAGNLNMTGTSLLTIQDCSPSTQPELTGTYTLTGGTIEFDGNCAGTGQTSNPNLTTAYNINLSTNAGATADTKNICGITTINGNLSVLEAAQMAACATPINMSCTGMFTINTSGTVTLGSDFGAGDVTLTSGALNIGANNLTVCGSNFINNASFNGGTGTVIINGNTTLSGSSTTTFNNLIINATKTFTGHATSFNVSGNWVNNGTYAHNSGTVVFSGTTDVSGTSTTQFNNLTINNGASLSLTSNIEIVGNWLNSNVAAGVSGNGAVTFTGGNTQNIDCGTQTFNNLTINKTAGTSVTLNTGAQTVSTLFTLTEGVFIAGTNTLDGTANYTQSGGDLQLAKLTTVPEFTGSVYSISGGTVTLNGSGNQSLNTNAASGGNTYNNLVFSNSGDKTVTGLTTINGNVDVLGSAILLNNSSFTQASSKLFTYSSSGTTQFSAATNVSFGKVLVTAGTFNINGITADVTGSTFTHTGGTITTSGTFQFNGAAAQTYSGTNIFNNVIINNANHLNLASDFTTQTTLDFTQGNIVTTSSYNAILNAGGMVNRTSGHVDGNFRKFLTAANDVVFYEIGFGATYTPLSFTFSGANAGQSLTTAAITGDHYDIYASTMDPNKTVNCYWRMSGNPGGSADVTFNYNAGLVDPLAVPSNFFLQWYVTPFWTPITPIPTPSNTVAIANISNFNGDFQFGVDFTPAAIYNAQTGTIPWNNQDSWIRYRTGNIAYDAASNAVAGIGTSFTTELTAGEILVSQSNPTVAIGTILSITDDNNLILTANASGTNASDSYGVKAIPTTTDEVRIGNGSLADADVTVQLDVDASIFKLNITDEVLANSTLEHLATYTLTTSSSAIIKQPPGAFINNWNIAAGTGAVAGNVQIGSNDNNAGRISKVTQTTGTLSIGSNLVMYHGNQVTNSVLDLSNAGNGVTNLKGSIVFTGGDGTYSNTSGDIFRYNGSATGQTVKNSIGFNYANLYLANTHAAGVGLQANITSSEVTNNIKVETGIFKNNGFDITSAGTDTFTVSNSATFIMSGSSVFPAGFVKYMFGASSFTKYFQTAPTTVDAQVYGYLYIQPQANAISHTFELGGITRSQSHMYIGDGIYSSIIADASTSTQLRIDSNLIIYTGATLIAPSTNLLMYGDFTNNGTFAHNSGTAYIMGTMPTQTITNNSATTLNFNNLIKHSVSTSTLTFGGSLTTLNIVGNLTLSNGTVDVGTLTTQNITGNITHNGATLNAPATLNLTGSFTTSSGIFNAGNNFNISGNWTNNGGTFNPGTGTVTFNNVTTARSITGTTTTHSFNNLNIMTAPQNFTIGGTTLNISGNLRDSSGTGTPITWPANMVFNGTVSSQNLYRPSASTTALNFTGITINNTSNTGTELTLNVPVNLSGNLTLTDGYIITTSTNIITLGTAATSSGASDNSFVKGPLINTYNSTTPTLKSYPIGKDALLHQYDLTIDLLNTNPQQVKIEYMNTSARDLGFSLPVGIERVSGIGYWRVDETMGTNLISAQSTLYYRTIDEVSDLTYLTVAQANSPWVDIGNNGVGGSAAPEGTITTNTQSQVKGYFSLANKIIGIDTGTNVLPVYLINFIGKKQNNNVFLSWITKAEKNNNYFEVQRSSDGSNYDILGYVKGKGTTVNENKYTFLDNEPLIGVNYYRLKQVDFDERFEISNVITFNFEDLQEPVKPIVKVFPNPSDGNNFKLEIENFAEEEVLVILRDISGKEVFAKVLVSNKNNAIEGREIQNLLPPGIYLITASNNNLLVSERLIIK